MCSRQELKLAVNLWCNLTWRWWADKWLLRRSEVAKMRLRSLLWCTRLKLSWVVSLWGSCSDIAHLRRPRHFAVLPDLLFAGCWVREKRSELQCRSGCRFVGNTLKRGPKLHSQQKAGSGSCRCNFPVDIAHSQRLGGQQGQPDSQFFTGSNQVNSLVVKSNPKSRQSAWKRCPGLKSHSQHNSGSQSHRSNYSLKNPE